MDVEIKSLVSGAEEAEGLTVIIDVFRAFTTLAYVFNNGAKEAFAVKRAEEAFGIKEQNPDFVLMGEDNGIIIDGFDYGNSPADIEGVDFSGKTVIMRTSAGTQGLLSVVKVDEIITGSFVNASAVASYIKSKNPGKVTLVAMGVDNVEQRDEDELCVQYIKGLLTRKEMDFNKILTHMRSYKSAKKFFNQEMPEYPERDFELCMALDRFDFVLSAKREGKHCRVVGK